MRKDTEMKLNFASISGKKKVEAAFDGGSVTSDGGVLHLRAIDTCIGLIERLHALGAPVLEQAKALSAAYDQAVRLFSSFSYQAQSWSKPRRIIFKAEVTEKGPNPRYVVTNLESSQASFIYERIYCARGRMEGFIKNHKNGLHSDRTSCHRFEANQFRLLLHSAAYVLIHSLVTKGLPGTQWVTAQFDTIQKRLLKVGAKICLSIFRCLMS